MQITIITTALFAFVALAVPRPAQQTTQYLSSETTKSLVTEKAQLPEPTTITYVERDAAGKPKVTTRTFGKQGYFWKQYTPILDQDSYNWGHIYYNGTSTTIISSGAYSTWTTDPNRWDIATSIMAPVMPILEELKSWMDNGAELPFPTVTKILEERVTGAKSMPSSEFVDACTRSLTDHQL
jgi:hypothetical protein